MTSTQRPRTIAGRTRRALNATRPPNDAPVEEASLEAPVAKAPVTEALPDLDDTPVDEADVVDQIAAVDEASAVSDAPTVEEPSSVDVIDEAPPDDVEIDPDAVPVLDVNDGTHPPRTRRRISRATAIAGSAAVTAAIFAGVAAGVWWGSSGDTHTVLGWHAEVDAGSAVSQSRDAALLAARQDVIVLNTADYQHATTSVNAWKNVSTGAMLSSIKDSPTLVKTIADSKFTTTAVVSAAAVTALDNSKGTASVIASVVLDRKQAGGGSDSIRMRLRADLQRVSGTWMLANLAPVTVSLG